MSNVSYVDNNNNNNISRVRKKENVNVVEIIEEYKCLGMY